MSTQALKVSTRDFSRGKGGRCAWLKSYHPCSAETSRKSGTLTYPEPLGPPRPVAGWPLLYFIPFSVHLFHTHFVEQPQLTIYYLGLSHSVFFFARQCPLGQGLLIHEVSRSHTTTHHSRTPLDEWSARRRDLHLTTITTDRHICPRWDLNPQSQQARGSRPTSYTARPLGPAFLFLTDQNLKNLAVRFFLSIFSKSPNIFYNSL